MRHDLSPARFFRSRSLARLLPSGNPPVRALPDPREREAARLGEWIHLRAWMRLAEGSRGARPQPG